MKYSRFSTLVFEKAKKYGKRPIIAYQDELLNKWIDITWQDLADRVLATARAFVAIGIEEQETIGICAQNMPQALMVDFANYANRAISVPMYATLSANQMEYLVNDAKIKVLFVGEQMQFDNAATIFDHCPTLQYIVVFDEKTDLHGNAHGIYFTDFLKLADSNDYDKYDNIVCHRQAAANEDDLAIIMYTSGTTGEPKGTMLSHSCFEECMRIHNIKIRTSKIHTSLAFLPLSHIFERGWTYFCLTKNIKVYLNRNPKNILDNIKEVRPNCMCSVPRFWEKVAIGVKEKITTFSPFQKGMVTWAIEIGRRYNLECRRHNKRANPWLWARYKFAEATIFSKLKKAIGVDRGIIFPVAGAAMNEHLTFFFRSLGIPTVVGYGLTETCATVAFQPYSKYILDSVGEMMPDIQVRIGEDNEIQLKGKTITKGYFNKPQETKAAFTDDGWFRTGDAGRLDGNTLYMTERIKDLFKTSNGKYISPQQLETQLGADKYIEQIAVIGNNRNFITAIIAPAMPALLEFAKEQNLRYNTIEELLALPEVQELYTQHIEEGQKGVASFEKIKRFRLIKQGFSMESGELTNTLKLRRAVIQQNYAALIEEMYDDVLTIQLEK